MCPKSPKVPETKETKPQYLRNPFLDGLAIGGGQSIGRNSLRVDPGTSVLTAPTPKPIATPGVTTPGTRAGLNTPRSPYGVYLN